MRSWVDDYDDYNDEAFWLLEDQAPLESFQEPRHVEGEKN